MPTLPREQCWLKCQERINTQKRLPLTPQSGFKQALRKKRASRVAQRVKNRLQCRRPGFDPWVGKIPWRREGLPTPVFWPGEFHGLYNPWGHKESGTTEWLSHFKEEERKDKETGTILQFGTIILPGLHSLWKSRNRSGKGSENSYFLPPTPSFQKKKKKKTLTKLPLPFFYRLLLCGQWIISFWYLLTAWWGMHSREKVRLFLSPGRFSGPTHLQEEIPYMYMLNFIKKALGDQISKFKEC